jgi:hypothetical protein
MASRDERMTRGTAPVRRTVALLALAGAVIGAVVAISYVASQPSPCCGNLKPFVSILPTPLSRIDATLAQGDGHAFAAIAEDPLMRRPEVFQDPRDFAYRAQRPVWGYLTWAGSLGQPGAVGWVMVALTVLSCGLACAATALLLLDRARSAWWALLVPVVGFETLTELTPELFGFALVACALLLWARDRRGPAIACLTVAALTRETMLIAVLALAAWELWHASGVSPRSWRSRVRPVVGLAIPFVAYGAWIVVIRLRLGDWPFNRSHDRLGFPLSGLVRALPHADDAGAIGFWVLAALALVAGPLLVARRDVLSWIAAAFLGLATVLGPDVWLTINGYQRTLIPLYLFGAVALVGGLPDRRPGRRPEHGASPGRADPDVTVEASVDMSASVRPPNAAPAGAP